MADVDFVLVDFDGTLAAADVGNQFFRRFASDSAAWDRLLEEWMAERITARECLARECEIARVSEVEAHAFTAAFELAPGAADFAARALSRGHEVAVASDGLSFYIEDLLCRAGLDLPFTANRLLFENGRPVPEFASTGPEVPLAGGVVARPGPRATPGCGRCGNCKGTILRQARESGRFARQVLVGDGYSDRCAATAADVVYAKDDLLDWCRRRGIPARPFQKLSDVVRAEGW